MNITSKKIFSPIWNKIGAYCRRSRHEGQASVEMAIAAPIFVLLLLIVTDFSRLFFLSIAVNNAARAGAQYGSRDVTDATAISAMEAAAQNDYGSGTLATDLASEWCACPNGSSAPSLVSCTPTLPTCSPQSDMRIYVQVQTAATFTTLVNYPGIPHSTTVNGNALMRAQ
jgi:Flp pilus assembly protein TadG